MALLGTIVDRKNPPEVDGTRPYTIEDLKFWIPIFKNVTKKILSSSTTFTGTYYIDSDGTTLATPLNSNGGSALYEKDGFTYNLTSDTYFVNGKTYYRDVMGTVATPVNCGLYEGELETMFENLYPIAYNKIFYSIFGTDWYYAMSLCIAHYNYLVNVQVPQTLSPNKQIGLNNVTGGGVTRGVMTSASIGGFTKSYDLGYTALSTEEALFWNQSAYGMSLLALYKSKSTLTAFVVTDGPLIPGSMPFNRIQRPYESGQQWVDDMINPRKFRP